MSKKKRGRTKVAVQTIGLSNLEPIPEDYRPQGLTISKVFAYFRTHLWVLGVVVLLSLGALGAVLKYLDDDARKQIAIPIKDRSMLSRVNPFIPAPLPSPTPQLSKTYIYAGSRLLAVEDANANAAPPADLAIWRPSTGVWCVMGSAGSTETYYQWGASTDKPVPGDFDGDGKTDFSVFRPSDGVWYIVNSSNGSQGGWQFGQLNDKPAAADFDGDGKTDSAVYRANATTGYADWFIRKSSDQTMSVWQWGLPTDIPAPADYDGDGKADIAVYRVSDSTFYVIRSIDTTWFGVALDPNSQITGEIPVSVDYDGDGKADCAIRHGSSWLIRKSSDLSTYTVTPTGDLPSDQPVQNDYDGDGKVDIAVWRDSNGTWYIRQSATNTLRQVQWGQTLDIPVPAFYRR